MRLREIVKWEPTGREFKDEFGVNLDVSITESEPLAYAGFSVLREYRMTAAFSAAVRCNNAEIDTLRDGLERHILRQMYGHIEMECHRALGAINSGDRRESLGAVSRIMKAVTWPSGTEG